MNRRALCLLVVAAVAVASCGENHHDAPTRVDPHVATTEQSDPVQQLGQAVRDAIQRDHRDAVRSLWTNRVPAHPAATGGPALAQWRRSTAVARRHGIRARMLSEHFSVVSVRLDPSYTSATADVRDDQRVQPSGRSGKPLGRSVVLHEHARLELRRVHGTDRFVVWSVEALR